jgi:hypothetical protein
VEVFHEKWTLFFFFFFLLSKLISAMLPIPQKWTTQSETQNKPCQRLTSRIVQVNYLGDLDEPFPKNKTPVRNRFHRHSCPPCQRGSLRRGSCCSIRSTAETRCSRFCQCNRCSQCKRSEAWCHGTQEAWGPRQQRWREGRIPAFPQRETQERKRKLGWKQ